MSALSDMWSRFQNPLEGFFYKWERRTMWMGAIAALVVVLFLVSLEL